MSDHGISRFKIEIADTNKTRQQGLMFRENLGVTQGMLFIFETLGNVSFWMKNTPLPLDMLFIDARGEIVRIEHQTTPYSEDGIDGGSPTILYVLEVNGGTARRFGIQPGDVIRHPRINQDLAAWTCND